MRERGRGAAALRGAVADRSRAGSPRDVELHGTIIPRGSQHLAAQRFAATATSATSPTPTAFDVRRDIDRHLAFGLRHALLRRRRAGAPRRHGRAARDAASGSRPGRSTRAASSGCTRAPCAATRRCRCGCAELGALSHIRICDLTRPARRRRRDAVPRRVRRPGDPHRGPGAAGPWDIVRGVAAVRRRPPRHRRSAAASTTTTSRSSASRSTCAPSGARSCCASWSRVSDVVTENFAAGVLERLGFAYDELQRDQARHRLRVELRASASRARTRRSRRGARSSRRCAGSPSASGLPDQPPAGWGYSYMDHTGGYFMAIAILAGAVPPQPHRRGPVGRHGVHRGRHHARRARPARLHGQRPPAAARRRSPTRNRSHVAGDGAARHLPGARRRQLGRHRLPRRRRLERAGRRRSASRGRPTRATTTLAGAPRRRGRARRAHRRRGRATRDRFDDRGSRSGPPACPRAVVARPEERIDHDPGTSEWGLWPTVAPHARWATCASTASRCTSRRPTGRSSAAGRASARTTTQVFGEVLGLTTPRSSGSRDGRGRSDVDAPRAARRRCGSSSWPASTRAFAGKLLADLGADVIVVEPPGGHASRAYGPVRRRRRRTRAQPLVVALQHVASAASCSTSTPPTAPRSSAAWSPTPTSCSRASRRARSPRSASTTTTLRAEHEPADLGLGHAVRARRPARARAGHRPHAARRRRPGVELRLRRPLAPAGARRRQPGASTSAARGR